MIDPSPYRSVAVASTFSPRFEQVLAEAKRIRDRFDSEHGANSLRRALHLAARENSERVYVVRLITTFDEARAKKEGTPAEADEDAKLEHFVLDLGHTDVPIEVRCIRGNTGFAAADFVKSVEADLLVVPLDPAKNAGQMPPNLEWLMDVIPCNLCEIRCGWG